jgi:hypothetical protein
LRATSGSNVQLIVLMPRCSAQTRWCCLSAKPTLRPAAVADTPAMWLCSSRSPGAAKKATAAPTRVPPSKAPAT